MMNLFFKSYTNLQTQTEMACQHFNDFEKKIRNSKKRVLRKNYLFRESLVMKVISDWKTKLSHVRRDASFGKMLSESCKKR